MRSLRRTFRGIRWRIIGAIVAVVATSQIAFGLYQADRDAARMRDDAQASSLALLRATVEPLVVPLANQELTTLDAVMARIAETRVRDDSDTREPSLVGNAPALPLLWVSILDTHGRVLAHTEPQHYGEDWSARNHVRSGLDSNEAIIREIQRDDGPGLLVTYPIVSGLRWGTAVTEISMLELEMEVLEQRERVLTRSLMISTVLAGLLSILLRGLVIEPVTRLSDAVRALASGDLRARVELGRTVIEFEEVGDSFNDMARQIENQTTNLEKQVEVRTAELEAAVTQLEEKARTDGLTGLSNHRHFQEVLNREIERSRRYGQPLALMMIDVDHFKSYNDYHGHPAGDEVLKAIARLFEVNLRSTDPIARYGGEEFSALVINSDLESAEAVGNKIVTAVREHDFEGEEESQPNGQVTVSIGVACFPDCADDGEMLLRAADDALYTAKKDGRNRVRTAQLVGPSS